MEMERHSPETPPPLPKKKTSDVSLAESFGDVQPANVEKKQGEEIAQLYSLFQEKEIGSYIVDEVAQLLQSDQFAEYINTLSDNEKTTLSEHIKRIYTQGKISDVMNTNKDSRKVLFATIDILTREPDTTLEAIEADPNEVPIGGIVKGKKEKPIKIVRGTPVSPPPAVQAEQSIEGQRGLADAIDEELHFPDTDDSSFEITEGVPMTEKEWVMNHGKVIKGKPVYDESLTRVPTPGTKTAMFEAVNPDEPTPELAKIQARQTTKTPTPAKPKKGFFAKVRSWFS